MMMGLILAGLVSFAAGLVLQVGAFAVFALITSMAYLALIYDGSAIFASFASAAALFIIMQIAYVIGVLVPFPIVRPTERRGLGFLKRRRVDPPRNKSG